MKRKNDRLTRRLLLLGAIALGGPVACDSLLDVDMPGRVPDTTLDNPGLAQTLMAGALGEFECAFAQYVTTTAVISEELWISSNLLASHVWGRRWAPNIVENVGNCGGNYGFYGAMQRARFMAEDGFERIEGFPAESVPMQREYMARLAAYAGYSYVLLGEGFCEVAFDEGPLETPDDAWVRATAWFDRAIPLADGVGDASIRNMAYMGRARANLNLGRTAQALADAQQVEAGFVREAGYAATPTRRNNRLFVSNHQNRDNTVPPAYRDLMIGDVPDTRVPSEDAGRMGQDGSTPLWVQLKFTELDAPIPIASWEEAQLTIAEALGGTEGIEVLNGLRRAQGLPEFEAGAVADRETIIEERRRQLYLEGHRLKDMLRLGIPFPDGFDHKGQPYGDVTCIPLPNVERMNNPNI